MYVISDIADVREAILATAVEASWELAYGVVSDAATHPVRDVDVFHATIEHVAVQIAYRAIGTARQ